MLVQLKREQTDMSDSSSTLRPYTSTQSVVGSIFVAFLFLAILFVVFYMIATIYDRTCRRRRSGCGKIQCKRPCDVQRSLQTLALTAGVTPAGVALSSDCKRLYVANNNNYGIPGADSVTVYNAKTLELITTIYDPSFDQPYTVTVSEDNKTLYVTNSNSSTVSIVDTQLNSVIGTIPGFDGPSGLAIVPGTQTAYVNNYGAPGGVGSGNGTTVSIVDLSLPAIVGTIIVQQAPAALAVSCDGTSLYVINYIDGNVGTGTMSIIDVGTNTVINTVLGFSGPFGLAVNKQNTKVYVTNFGSNNFAPYGTSLSVVDVAGGMITATVQLGIQPSGVAVDAEDRYIYVSNYNTLYADPITFEDLTPGQGTVNVISVCDGYRVLPDTFTTGQAPAAVVLSKRHLYVANFIGNTVTVLPRVH
jgi:YVTN family beta-propeller protein